ncbi:MAG: type II toxin-antitoxin system death-on-curing family toxin [Clostridia bacterium]|nr:type II toxin-antitoxin system death-on-curing family toxin [Clostridia bacterium]
MMPEGSWGGVYFHTDLFTMAAAYAFHIRKKHPFIDRNKRTALVSALVFLELNGLSLDDPMGMLYQAMMNIASGEADKYHLATLLRRLASQNQD